MKIFDTSKKHLFGKILVASKGNCSITNMNIPIAKDFLVLTAQSMENNFVEFANEKIPFFADEYVRYPGQPVMAVFGPDPESVELYCRKIVIEYSDENRDFETHEVASLEKSYKLSDYDVPAETTSFSSHFEVHSICSPSFRSNRTQVVFKDGKLHILTATSWPTKLKTCVSRALGIRREDVIVYGRDYYSPFNEVLIQPILISIVAASASITTNLPVEIIDPYFSSQPELSFDFTSYVDKDFHLVSHKAKVSGNMGAYPIFAKEYCHQLFAGLTPVYPLIELSLSVFAESSFTKPANFFNDFGYSMAVAATESHFTKFASKLGISPATFKMAQFDSSVPFSISEQIRKSSCRDSVPSVLADCFDGSDFKRIYTINSQEGVYRNSASPFTRYSRGIGIAVGEGVQGFSSTFDELENYSISLTLTEKKKAEVSIGFEPRGTTKKIWTNTIKDILQIPADDILYLDINDSRVFETGPSVLSRTTRYIPALLESSCREILHRLEAGEALPISIVSSHKNDSKSLFLSDTCCSVSVALHINTISLLPEVDTVWVRAKFGKVFNMSLVKSELRKQVNKAISTICPCANKDFNIEINILYNNEKPSGSASSAVFGLTVSAFLSALAQACGHSVDSVPVTETDVLNAVVSSTEEAHRED